MESGETVEETIVREVKEETGLTVEPKGVIGISSDPNRDPRGHVISIAFHAQIVSDTLEASSYAVDVRTFF